MDRALEQLVRERARHRCEYCGRPQGTTRFPLVIDHVIARQHGGPRTAGNLALACGFCNAHKGPNIAGLDPETGQLTRLFDPRRDAWDAHFKHVEPMIVGLTPVGRTTVYVLATNHEAQLALRRALGDPQK